MLPILAGLCIAGSALVSALVTVVVRRWARSAGFVDRPGGHKGHRGEVPLGGGIAIVAAVVLPMFVVLVVARLAARGWFGPLPEFVRTHLGGVLSKSPEGLGLIAGAVVLHILGLADDLRPIHSGVKLLVQIAVAGFLVLGFDVRVLSHLAYPVSALVSILWIVTIVNAFNFLDNMDGLAVGVAAIAIGIYSITAARVGQVFVPAACWLLLGALLGFLPFNFQPASIFLGDAGSTVIGFLIAVFTILTTFHDPRQNQQTLGVLAPLVVLAVPLYDTISVLFIRWREGRPLWAPDRRHFSHRLVQAGTSTRRAVLVIWLATLTTALPAVLLPNASWLTATFIFIQTVAVVTLVALLEGSPRHDVR